MRICQRRKLRGLALESCGFSPYEQEHTRAKDNRYGSSLMKQDLYVKEHSWVLYISVSVLRRRSCRIESSDLLLLTPERTTSLPRAFTAPL